MIVKNHNPFPIFIGELELKPQDEAWMNDDMGKYLISIGKVTGVRSKITEELYGLET